jgi:hypothetical protein
MHILKFAVDARNFFAPKLLPVKNMLLLAFRIEPFVFIFAHLNIMLVKNRWIGRFCQYSLS